MILAKKYSRPLTAAALCIAVVPLMEQQSNDPGAGNWQMILLSGPTQIAVATPAPVTDSGYQQELAAIRSSQSSLTSAQKTAIQNWSGSGMVRWNQILIGLVASADLPPEPNSDGTYSFPNPARPFAFPQYPFANPPYAARPYSYVAAAQ